jgi:hypothetical protein
MGAEKPATVSFYKAKLRALMKHLGPRRLDEIEEAEIEQYTQLRAKTKSRNSPRFAACYAWRMSGKSWIACHGFTCFAENVNASSR